jgi:hypothetical protein
MRGSWMLVGLTLSLSVPLLGCNDAEKKAAEAKAAAEKQSAEIQAAAEKQAAEAKAAAEKQAAEAAAQAKAAFESSKKELLAKLTEGVEAMDRKLDFLKQKAAKLPKPLKAKAEAALATFDTAKAALLGAKTDAENATDPATFSELSTKATTALADAQKALEAAETAIMKK